MLLLLYGDSVAGVVMLTFLSGSLIFSDYCHDITSLHHLPRYRSLCYTANALLCGVVDGPFLDHALGFMLRLQSFTMEFYYDELHGLSWSTLKAVLSGTRLRDIVI